MEKKEELTKVKKGRGRPAYVFDERVAKQILSMSGFGIIQEDIARSIGMSVETMKRLYSEQLQLGHIQANVNVAQSLYAQAVRGNVTAAIFWMKTRAGWKETSRIDVDMNERKTVLVVPEHFASDEEWEIFAAKQQETK